VKEIIDIHAKNEDSKKEAFTEAPEEGVMAVPE